MCISCKVSKGWANRTTCERIIIHYRFHASHSIATFESPLPVSNRKMQSIFYIHEFIKKHNKIALRIFHVFSHFKYSKISI